MCRITTPASTAATAAITAAAAAHPDWLVDVHDDLLEAADLIIPVAEYVEEEGAARGPVGEPTRPAFLAPPEGSGRG